MWSDFSEDTMISTRHIASLAAALALTAGLLTGCGSASSSGSGQSITLYNGQHEQTTDSLVEGFEKQTGIKVNVRNDDEDTLADEIVTEGSNSPADVVYTENSPALEYLQGKGLLAPVDSATLAHTPSRYNSPQGDWLGVSARVSVLIYNPSLIGASELPRSVTELADPKYGGKLAFAAGETDFQPIVTSYARTYGEAAALKWLEAIKSNAGSHVYPDNETIADEVNRGAVAFGVVNQYYWYRMRAELGASNVPSKIAYFAPRDPGYVLDVSSAGILKSSRRQADAQKFLAFLVSKQGQEIIAHSISFEYPIASAVSTTAPETPLDQLQPNPITIPQLGDGSTAIALLRKSGQL
jgi:iron(III) transport system substrate-binding protein